MNVVKCKNGHFFDGDTYTVCPHCGEGIGAQDTSAEKQEPAKKKFPWGHKEKTEKQQNSYEPSSFKAPDTDFLSNTPTDVIKEKSESATPAAQTPKNEHTLDFFETVQTEDDTAPEHSDDSSGEELSSINIPKAEEIPASEPIREEKAQSSHAAADSLKDAVQKASASNEGKTMSYFSAAMSENSGAANTVRDPVVGWLVCIGGKHFGESFNIGAGKNSIGRAEDNRIVLSKDNKVSRSKHALITYEPKKRNFYLQPGDSSGLTYLNDEYIEESKKLNLRDVIELGDSKFIFIPLCDETFSWEDYIAEA